MPRSQLKARGSAESKRDHTVTATSQHTRTHNTIKKEAARTHIYRETQHVAPKMNKLLRHERPHWRMESVTPRRLDVTCFFRLDQRANLAVDRRQDLSSKPAAPPHSEHNEERNRPHAYLLRDATCGKEDEQSVSPRKTTSAYGIGDRLVGLMRHVIFGSKPATRVFEIDTQDHTATATSQHTHGQMTQ